MCCINKSSFPWWRGEMFFWMCFCTKLLEPQLKALAKVRWCQSTGLGGLGWDCAPLQGLGAVTAEGGGTLHGSITALLGLQGHCGLGRVQVQLGYTGFVGSVVL